MSRDVKLDGLSDLTRREALRRGAVTVPLLSLGGGLLAACSSSEEGGSSRPPSKPTGTLRVGLPHALATIDPANGIGVPEFLVGRNVYNTLTKWDSPANNEIVGDLATRWESSADARVWTFELRKGVRFHDGSRFDAGAVVKTLEYASENILGFHWGKMKATALSPQEVRIVFDDPPIPDFAQNATILKMMSPKLLAEGPKAIAQRAVGTGPFRLVSNSPTRLLLEANEDYWDDGPFLQRVELRPITNATARLNALLSGQLDLILNVAPNQRDQLERNDAVDTATVESWTVQHLILDCEKGPTKDARVRRALAYAIDRDAIVDKVQLGQAIKRDTIVPSGVYGFTEPETRYTYQPDRAKELLAEAGYGDGLEISIAVGAGQFVRGEDVCYAIAGQMEAAGIRARVDVQDAGVSNEEQQSGDLKHDIILSESGWLDGSPLHLVVDQSLGLPGYTGDELVGLVEKLKRTANSDERLQLMADIQNLWAIELPEIPMYQLKLTHAYLSSVERYTPPKDGFLSDFSATYLSS